jgi:hypothetical protein
MLRLRRCGEEAGLPCSPRREPIIARQRNALLCRSWHHCLPEAVHSLPASGLLTSPRRGWRRGQGAMTRVHSPVRSKPWAGTSGRYHRRGGRGTRAVFPAAGGRRPRHLRHLGPGMNPPLPPRHPGRPAEDRSSTLAALAAVRVTAPRRRTALPAATTAGGPSLPWPVPPSEKTYLGFLGLTEPTHETRP